MDPVDSLLLDIGGASINLLLPPALQSIYNCNPGRAVKALWEWEPKFADIMVRDRILIHTHIYVLNHCCNFASNTHSCDLWRLISFEIRDP